MRYKNRSLMLDVYWSSASPALINLAFVGAIGLFAVNLISKIGAEIEEIGQIDMPLLQAITAIEIHQLEQAHLFERAMRLAEKIKLDPDAKQSFDLTDKKLRELSLKVDQELIDAEKKTKEDIVITPFEEDRKEFEYVLEALEKIDQEHHDYEEHIFALLAFVEKGKWDYAVAKDMIHKVKLPPAEPEAYWMTPSKG